LKQPQDMAQASKSISGSTQAQPRGTCQVQACMPLGLTSSAQPCHAVQTSSTHVAAANQSDVAYKHQPVLSRSVLPSSTAVGLLAPSSESMLAPKRCTLAPVCSTTICACPSRRLCVCRMAHSWHSLQVCAKSLKQAQITAAHSNLSTSLVWGGPNCSGPAAGPGSDTLPCACRCLHHASV
jgi:hypothetical protein